MCEMDTSLLDESFKRLLIESGDKLDENNDTLGDENLVVHEREEEEYSEDER